MWKLNNSSFINCHIHELSLDTEDICIQLICLWIVKTRQFQNIRKTTGLVKKCGHAFFSQQSLSGQETIR